MLYTLVGVLTSRWGVGVLTSMILRICVHLLGIQMWDSLTHTHLQLWDKFFVTCICGKTHNCYCADHSINNKVIGWNILKKNDFTPTTVSTLGSFVWTTENQNCVLAHSMAQCPTTALWQVTGTLVTRPTTVCKSM